MAVDCRSRWRRGLERQLLPGADIVAVGPVRPWRRLAVVNAIVLVGVVPVTTVLRPVVGPVAGTYLAAGLAAATLITGALLAWRADTDMHPEDPMHPATAAAIRSAAHGPAEAAQSAPDAYSLERDRRADR